VQQVFHLLHEAVTCWWQASCRTRINKRFKLGKEKDFDVQQLMVIGQQKHSDEIMSTNNDKEQNIQCDYW